jgi:beta-phosphoglucomutase-like phosphatase (HAD superfamily)
VDRRVWVRVRPQVARAVANARHVLLDFDGVCFAMPELCRPRAVLDAMRPQPRRRIGIPAYSVAHVLGHLAVHQPELADAAESVASIAELDAAITAPMTRGLPEVLGACADGGRRVWVVGEFDEDAMRAGLRAHGVGHRVAVVAGRQGLDAETFGTVDVAARAARLLGVDPALCLLVSGQWGVLRAARESGMALLGVVCGHDNRKWLSDGVPVVSNLERLAHALSAGGEHG